MAAATVAMAAATASVAAEPRLADRVRGIVMGAAIADALAAPAHWYYDTRALRSEYGEIRDFVKPRREHSGSIMGLSNTGGAGRGSQEGDIIGGVINHGKRGYWRRGVHYHATLAKGENTLNEQVNRLSVRTMVALGAYDPDEFLRAYVDFMTTPGSHNDAYAESYHRLFFANWKSGKPPSECAGDDHHNIASMGGFVMLPPVAAFAACKEKDRSRAVAAGGEAAARHVLLTHRSEALAAQAGVFGELISKVVLGAPLKESLVEAGRAIGVDVVALSKLSSPPFSTACYIEDSFPWLLFLAYKHGDSPEEALVQNVMAGGENCHRGAALGALLGAAHGAEAFPARWREGLFEAKAIADEADAFAGLLAADGSAAE
jgi:ADP-ribosyl-[dinitrogen reductase] hydrolase